MFTSRTAPPKMLPVTVAGSIVYALTREVASIGCAVANYVGNEGHTIVALLMIGGVLAYVFVALKPLEGWKKP